MPKKEMDFSNVQFYKIVCKDLSITDCYVGQTTNFTKRKWNHKNSCINEQDKGHNLLIYQFIRNNGNWNNWDMILIETGSFENFLEASKRERELVEELHATLNRAIPNRTRKERIQSTNYKEKKREQSKIYRDRKKDQILDYSKIYNKTYYETNRDKILEKLNAKEVCICGSEYSHAGKNRHEKTKKHQQYTILQQEQLQGLNLEV